MHRQADRCSILCHSNSSKVHTACCGAGYYQGFCRCPGMTLELAVAALAGEWYTCRPALTMTHSLSLRMTTRASSETPWEASWRAQSVMSFLRLCMLLRLCCLMCASWSLALSTTLPACSAVKLERATVGDTDRQADRQASPGSACCCAVAARSLLALHWPCLVPCHPAPLQSCRHTDRQAGIPQALQVAA